MEAEMMMKEYRRALGAVVCFVLGFGMAQVSCKDTDTPTPIEPPVLASAKSEPECNLEIMSRQYLSIKPLFESIEQLKQDSQKPDETFSNLIAKSQKVEHLANQLFEDIQAVGCKLPKEQELVFSRCMSIVRWHCESFRFSVDLAFLAKVKKTKEEELAFSLAIDPAMISENNLLFGQFNLFRTCCSDFGCAPDGVGIPASFYQPATLQKIISLALGDGTLGDMGAHMLEGSAAYIKGAKCSCNLPQPEDMKAVTKNVRTALDSVNAGSPHGKLVQQSLQSILDTFARGLPKTECRLPG
jgi:hypothetical protein